MNLSLFLGASWGAHSKSWARGAEADPGGADGAAAAGQGHAAPGRGDPGRGAAREALRGEWGVAAKAEGGRRKAGYKCRTCQSFFFFFISGGGEALETTLNHSNLDIIEDITLAPAIAFSDPRWAARCTP